MSGERICASVCGCVGRFYAPWLRMLLVLGVLSTAASFSITEQPVAASGPVGTWSPAGSPQVARMHPGAVLLDANTALVAGGTDYCCTTYPELSSAELYNIPSNTWRATGSMHDTREVFTLTLLADGRVLAAGGRSHGSPRASAEIYTPATGTWTLTGSLTIGRSSHTATLLNNGKVLVAGGTDGLSTQAAAELYDPSTGLWSSAGTLATSRDVHTATLLTNGTVLVAGGLYVPPASFAIVYQSTAEIYNPTTNAWTTTGTMALGRTSHTAALLANGDVLVAGGTGFDGNAYSEDVAKPVEIYHPTSSTSGGWSTHGSLVTGRASATAARLLDGSVLIAGGSNTGTPLASAERYDFVNQTFAATGSMGKARTLLIGVLLPGGNYFVPGGSGATPSAEIYNGPPAAPVATLNTTAATFGAQSLGTSQTRFITLSNTGTAPLAVSTVTVSSTPNGGFTLAGDTCAGQSIAAGGICGVTVRFQPATAQSYTGTLSFTDNAGGSPQAVSLSGSGTTAAGGAVLVSPSSVNFGNVPLGTNVNGYKAVQITNAGSQPFAITSLTLTGGNVDDFGITEYRCQGLTLAPNDYCTTYLSFHPGATGGRATTLNIYSYAISDPTVPTTVSLSGSGITSAAPLIDVRTDLTDFGSQNVGSTSTPQSVSLMNSGNAPLTVSSITFAGNSLNAADFTMDASTCVGQTLPGGTACALSITFRPGAAGTRKAILIVNDTAADSPQLAFLQGKGVPVANAPAVTLTPQSLNFGNQNVNTTSGAATVTLQNPGTVPLSVTSIATSGDFSQTNTCGTSVAVGGSCAINVTFTPTQQTFLTGTLSVTDNASGSPHQVSLAGTGVTQAAGAPAWNGAYPISLAFGDVAVYGLGIGTVTLQNATYATAPMTIISCTATGDFVVAYGCDGTVAVGQYHDINIQVDPTHLGQQTGTLTVTTNDAGSPHHGTLTVNGTGAPVVQLPTSLDIGNQPVATTSRVNAVTLHNSGNVPLGITNIAAGGEFAATNTCPASLNAYTSCTINVTFTPTQLGARTGTLTITDNATGSPHTVSLTGTGTAAPPHITHLSTITVPAAGGTQVTITGTGFQAGTVVFFGGAAGRVVGAPTATSITVVTPPHNAGTVDVVAANPDGQYSDVFVSFSFIPAGGVAPPMPHVTVPPSTGANPVPMPRVTVPQAGGTPNPNPPSH